MDLKEDFLSFIWQFRQYKAQNLTTTTGEQLQVLQVGQPNKHAGPDFFNAKVIVAGTTWIGNVEIHVRSSEWIGHGHEQDLAYNNVILHVVLEDDLPVQRADGSFMPTLELKYILHQHILENYNGLVEVRQPFPCHAQVATVDPLIFHTTCSRTLIERLEFKSKEVQEKLEQHKGDWEATFNFFLARSFGFKVNALPFELLASSFDMQLYAKYRDAPLQTEALIFGQAGFLEKSFNDRYPEQLRREYIFLKQKHGLSPMEVSIWKFLRMRPSGFPTIRLAQFAALMNASHHLFSKMLHSSELKDLKAILSKLPIHSYWTGHYHFEKQAPAFNPQLGIASIESIIINSICLITFSYGRIMDSESYMNKAIFFLEQLPAENNHILRQYRSAGLKIETAFTSQALLQLNKHYCGRMQCLRCGIGVNILKRT
jgi:hypothetical protein